MQFFKVINIDSISEDTYKNFNKREAVRGLVLNTENKIALLHETVNNYYSLPGGAVEGEESPEEAFIRECAEEIGVAIKISLFLGLIREIKSHNIINDSYCYLANKTSEVFDRTFTEESEENSEVVWVSPLEAVNLIKNSDTSHNPKSISSLNRDIEIINKFLSIKPNS